MELPNCSCPQNRSFGFLNITVEDLVGLLCNGFALWHVAVLLHSTVINQIITADLPHSFALRYDG